MTSERDRPVSGALTCGERSFFCERGDPFT